MQSARIRQALGDFNGYVEAQASAGTVEGGDDPSISPLLPNSNDRVPRISSPGFRLLAFDGDGRQVWIPPTQAIPIGPRLSRRARHEIPVERRKQNGVSSPLRRLYIPRKPDGPTIRTPVQKKQLL